MKKIPTIFNILFLTAAIYFSVDIFYGILMAKLGHTHFSSIMQKQGPPSEHEASRPFSYYKKIIDRNLFGIKEESEQDMEDLVTETLPETNLKLKLWGTVIDEVDKSYAVIEEIASKNQDLYRRGDTIQSATVKRILRQKVVLTIDGRDEILLMQVPGAGDRKDIDQPLEEPKLPINGQEITIKLSRIENAIEDKKFMRNAKILPHFENAKVVGLRLTEIKPNSILREMGLKDGDIVKSLDGKNFQRTHEVMSYYKSLPPSSSMTLEIVRDGKEKTITYNLD